MKTATRKCLLCFALGPFSSRLSLALSPSPIRNDYKSKAIMIVQLDIFHVQLQLHKSNDRFDISLSNKLMSVSWSQPHGRWCLQFDGRFEMMCFGADFHSEVLRSCAIKKKVNRKNIAGHERRTAERVCVQFNKNSLCCWFFIAPNLSIFYCVHRCPANSRSVYNFIGREEELSSPFVCVVIALLSLRVLCQMTKSN